MFGFKTAFRSEHLLESARGRGATALFAGGLICAPLAACNSQPAVHHPAATQNITVNFTMPTAVISPLTFGADVTGYGGDGVGQNIDNDATQRSMLQGLYGQMRIGLTYTIPGKPASLIITNAVGGTTSVSGDQWVTDIKRLGATPIVIVPENVTDATNLVRHFNTGSNLNPVPRWIIGNEPSEPEANYAANFEAIAASMKSVDSTIKVGGPALSHYDSSWLNSFITAEAPKQLDFIDYHAYGEGGSSLSCDTALLSLTPQYESNIQSLKTAISAVTARLVDIQIGEVNTSWSTDHNPTSLASCGNVSTEPIQYRNAAVIWNASVMGHILKAGGFGMAYGDKNGSLGLLYDLPGASRPAYAQNGAGLDERMASYNGIGFFTGQSGTSLARFGTNLVSASTTLGTSVEVYASSNPKVLVIVNKAGTSQSGVLGVGSTVTSAMGYQKTGSTVSYAKPASLGNLAMVSGKVNLTIPGYSVTQLKFQ